MRAMTSSISKFLDYYGILGLPLDASQSEITLAFQLLVQQYMPDLSAPDLGTRQDAELALADIKEAYEILGDSIRRWLYDQQRQDMMDQEETPRLQVIQARRGTSFGSSRAYQQPGRPSISPPAQRGVGAFIRRMFIPNANSQQKQMMGVVRKLLLVPTSFCASTIMAAFFWHLGHAGYAFLFDLTAILSYPLILFPVFIRLQFPVRFTPKLSPPQKVLWTPLILLVATLLSWVWLALADHNGQKPSPLDIYFWLVLVMSVCLSLAYL